MGRRLDDIGAASALPAMGHVRFGLCTAGVAGKIALVYAVALRTMARDEFDAIRPFPCRTGRGKTVTEDRFGPAYLHWYAASEQQE